MLIQMRLITMYQMNVTNIKCYDIFTCKGTELGITLTSNCACAPIQFLRDKSSKFCQGKIIKYQVSA